jgi:FkbM family methyltransferase
MLSPIVYRYVNPILSKYFKFVIKRRSEDLAFQRETILKKFGIELVLDVGAHHGEFVREIRSNGYKGRIISFEPDKNSFIELGKIQDHNLEIFFTGLSSEEGFLKFNKYQNSFFNSFLEIDNELNIPITNLIESSFVKVTTLDSFLEKNLIYDKFFLKLDVQGFEMKILKGLNDYLENLIALQVEVSINAIYSGASNLEEILDWLFENGFHIVSIVTERFDQKMAQAFDVDLLCLKISRS